MIVLSLYPEIISSIVNVTIEEIEKSERLLKLLHHAYFIENKKTACCFETALKPFYKKLINYYQLINPNYQKPIQMGKDQNAEFQLKPKMKLMTPTGGAMQQVNEDNLTDESAVATLAANKGRIKCFSKYPSDWEKRVAAFKKESPSEKKSR